MFEGLFQPMHLLVILGLALLVFGPRKLPELGKGLGEAIRGFRSSISGGEAVPHSPATRADGASGSPSPSDSSEFPQQTRSR
jgi:sec-independent protein translocase protein TatA